jgi:hypothetical protein
MRFTMMSRSCHMLMGMSAGPGSATRSRPASPPDALTAQSGRMDGGAGAAFTGEAYAASLQAALDALHMK